MNMNEMFAVIEGLAFTTLMETASGFRILMFNIESHETVKQLVERVQQSPQAAEIIFERLRVVLAEDKYPGHAHEHDTSITAYLYVLTQTNADLAAAAAEQIAQMPSLFWAAKLAKQTLEPDPALKG